MSVLDRDAVLDALDHDMRRYPPGSPDRRELERIRQLLLKAQPDDEIHLIAITSKQDRAHGN